MKFTRFLRTLQEHFEHAYGPLSNDLSYIQTGLFLFPPNMVVGGGGGGALPHVFIITN